MPRQRASFVVLLQHEVETLRQALDLVRLRDRWNVWLAAFAILTSVEIERLDGFAAFFVKALARLVAEASAVHLLLAERFDARRAKNFACGILRNQVVEVSRDGARDVETDQIQQPERGGLRPANQWSDDRVGLLDRVAALENDVEQHRAGDRC